MVLFAVFASRSVHIANIRVYKTSAEWCFVIYIDITISLELEETVCPKRKGYFKVNIQIFGVKKCFDTQKAERYFRERNIKYQYIDLNQKGLSKGELQSVKAAVGLNNLIDQKAKDYNKLNLDRIGSASMREEILFNHPLLYKTPIVRNGKLATVGYQTDVWKEWE